jgi:hypothetical protein
MADEQSPRPEIPNFADEQILQDEIRRNQRHRAANPTTEGTPEAPRGATGGVGGNVTENPRGDLDGRMIAQMELQTNAFLKAMAVLTAAQGATAAVQAPTAAPPAAQVVQMAQNTQELSLTTR